MANPLSLRGFEFQGNPIRCAGTDRDLWFVAADVCAVLGITWSGATLKDIDPEWKRLLQFNIHRRNAVTSRPVTEELVVINEAALYQLVFRSRKPEAKSFARWVFSEVLPAIRKTGSYTTERRAKYERQGKQLEWIEQREEGIEARKGLTDTLKDHGVKDRGYPDCTNAIYRPVLGGTASLVKARRGLKPKAQLRDSLSTIELAKVKLAELFAAERIEQERLEGNDRCAKACRLSGSAVAAAARLAEQGPLDPPALDG
jgi:prophage antirepressor-like protein